MQTEENAQTGAPAGSGHEDETAMTHQDTYPTGAISGTIVYAGSGAADDAPRSQAPLPRVRISLVKISDDGKPEEPRRETIDTNIDTNDEGRFQTDRLERGRWQIELDRAIEIDTDALPEDHALRQSGISRLKLADPHDAAIRVSVGAEVIDIGVIGYAPAGSAVWGEVLAQQGSTGARRPLAGVRVMLIPLAAKDQHFIETTTDVRGIYTFSDLEPRRYRLGFETTLDANRLGLGQGKLRLASDPPPAFLVVAGRDEKQDPVIYEGVGGDIRGMVFNDADGDGRRLGAEPGIDDVSVSLISTSADGFREQTTTTRNGGQYEFLNLPAGVYAIQLATIHRDADGEEHSLTTPASQEVKVAAGEKVTPPATGYRSEPHEIVGRATYDDGTPIAGLVVTLEQNGVVIDTALTDAQGAYVFRDRRGVFMLRFPSEPFARQLLSPETREARVNSIFDAGTTVYRRTPGGPGRTMVDGTGGGVQDNLTEMVSDIAAYMPTSQEIGGAGQRPRSSGAGAPAALQEVVDRELMAVLGGRLKTTEGARPDPKAFLASLTRAFAAEQTEGQTRYKHIPRIYAVQTELGGAITGAQASLYRRAKVALDDALPLLDRLEPLDPKADSEETAALRSIVRTQLIELVNELGREGGPRVQRVDDAFKLLKGHIERLQISFGLSRNRVVTVAEEQRLTDFFVLRDYVTSLHATWNDNRDSFTGGDRRFLGTQLVLLSRALNSVAESVDETYRVMDSVMLGPAERQTVRIDFPPDEQGNRAPSLLVEELLSWVGRFATDEGPTLMQQGGRPGVEAVRPIAGQLQRLVESAARADAPHIAFSRTRVRRALRELASQLGQVERLASELAINA